MYRTGILTSTECLWKKSKKIWISREIYCVHGLEDNTVKMLISSKFYTGLMKLLSKFQHIFFTNIQKIILKFILKGKGTRIAKIILKKSR